jgi:hypothetical protein
MQKPQISWQQVYEKIGFRPSQTDSGGMYYAAANYAPPFRATCDNGIVTVHFDLTADTPFRTQALESDAARAWELMCEHVRNFASNISRISDAITPKATRDVEVTIMGTSIMHAAPVTAPKGPAQPRPRGNYGMMGDHD